MTEYIPIPDEELTEPIHLVVGPRKMRCGAETGIGVLDEQRVTCRACRATLEVRPTLEAG